ncbi:MAG: hypothetical protein ACTHMW_00700, partial [Actinomycetes bacterium]
GNAAGQFTVTLRLGERAVSDINGDGATDLVVPVLCETRDRFPGEYRVVVLSAGPGEGLWLVGDAPLADREFSVTEVQAVRTEGQRFGVSVEEDALDNPEEGVRHTDLHLHWAGSPTGGQLATESSRTESGPLDGDDLLSPGEVRCPVVRGTQFEDVVYVKDISCVEGLTLLSHKRETSHEDAGGVHFEGHLWVCADTQTGWSGCYESTGPDALDSEGDDFMDLPHVRRVSAGGSPEI